MRVLKYYNYMICSATSFLNRDYQFSDRQFIQYQLLHLYMYNITLHLLAISPCIILFHALMYPPPFFRESIKLRMEGPYPLAIIANSTHLHVLLGEDLSLITLKISLKLVLKQVFKLSSSSCRFSTSSLHSSSLPAKI